MPSFPFDFQHQHAAGVFNNYLLSESFHIPNTASEPTAISGAEGPALGCSHMHTPSVAQVPAPRPIFPGRAHLHTHQGCPSQHEPGHPEPWVPSPLIIW